MTRKYLEYKDKILKWYEQNEKRADISFFLGGFLFDIVTLSEIDDTFSLLQQVFYLVITAWILYYEFLVKYKFSVLPKWLEAYWLYRRPVFHFFLGSLLSVYSLFFLMSSSIFSTVIFVVILLVIMVANELKTLQEKEVNAKIGLHVLCLFCFLSILYPTLLGFVGLFPFLLSLGTAACLVLLIYNQVHKKHPSLKTLGPQFVIPAFTVLGIILVCYLMGWVPPVPVSVQSMGVYHKVEKVGANYALFHQKPSWKFWQTGDQKFLAEPGDKIYFYTRIYSPGRFNDSIFLHWYFKDPKQGWLSTDQLPMTITGGRKKGFRGFTVKQNYTPGEWRISVETSDRREIGRIYFDVLNASPDANRTFIRELQ